MSLAKLRREYERAGLSEADVASDPLVQFRAWLEDAVSAGVRDATAMTLATATRRGAPSARIVLLKGADRRGLTFFTNYRSRKGRELAENPRAALVFFWSELDRQVRVTGLVRKVSAAESRAYFASRPRGSQISAAASPQSRTVTNRAELEDAARMADARWAGGNVPCPAQWGGYRLVPAVFEFWQGRPDRLHDRLRYRRIKGRWRVDRLGP